MKYHVIFLSSAHSETMDHVEFIKIAVARESVGVVQNFKYWIFKKYYSTGLYQLFLNYMSCVATGASSYYQKIKRKIN
jgi:hypothetical protein